MKKTIQNIYVSYFLSKKYGKTPVSERSAKQKLALRTKLVSLFIGDSPLPTQGGSLPLIITTLALTPRGGVNAAAFNASEELNNLRKGDRKRGAPMSARSDSEDIDWGCELAGP